MFARRKRDAAPAFDSTGKEPVIRSSICTGEKVAGYRDVATGRFTEVMLLRDEGDLRRFLAEYGFQKEEIKYEW